MLLHQEWLSFKHTGSHSTEGSIPTVTFTDDIVSLYYCFYQREPNCSEVYSEHISFVFILFSCPTAVETCYHTHDIGAGYRGTMNFAHLGACTHWSRHIMLNPNSYIENRYVLAENFCSSTHFFEDKPWCSTVKGASECGMPPCG